MSEIAAVLGGVNAGLGWLGVSASVAALGWLWLVLCVALNGR